MDFSLVTGAVASLNAAKEIGRTLVELRDFNKGAAQIAELNRLLLQAQDGLFAHNAQLLQLQSDYFEASQKLRKLEEAAAERQRYTLVELTKGTFAYKANIVPTQSAASEPVVSEPEHYLCQPCYDGGVKSVLQRMVEWSTVYGKCSICKTQFATGASEPVQSLNFPVGR